jgi:hypothetical protein
VGKPRHHFIVIPPRIDIFYNYNALKGDQIEGILLLGHTTSSALNTANMDEDDIYRTSTQYRLWSFTTDTLESMRATTNALAAQRVRDAVHRVHMQKNGANGAQIPEVDTLTAEEELKLVGYYCQKAMELADICEFPTNVKVPSPHHPPSFYNTDARRPLQSSTLNASTSPTPP